MVLDKRLRSSSVLRWRSLISLLSLMFLISCEGEVDQLKVTDVVPPGEFEYIDDILQKSTETYSWSSVDRAVWSLDNGYLEVRPYAFMNAQGDTALSDVQIDVTILDKMSLFVSYQVDCRSIEGDFINPRHIINIKANTQGEPLMMREDRVVLHILDQADLMLSEGKPTSDKRLGDWETSTRFHTANDYTIMGQNGESIDVTGFEVALSDSEYVGLYSQEPSQVFGDLCVSLPQAFASSNTRVYLIRREPSLIVPISLSEDQICDFTETPSMSNAELISISHLGSDIIQAASIERTTIQPGQNRISMQPIGLDEEELQSFLFSLN